MITADELRRAALSLPEAEERETWGPPTFRVRDKLFASLSGDGRSAGVSPGAAHPPSATPVRRPGTAGRAVPELGRTRRNRRVSRGAG